MDILHLIPPPNITIQEFPIKFFNNELEKRIYEVAETIAVKSIPSYTFIFQENPPNGGGYANLWLKKEQYGRIVSLQIVGEISTKEEVDNVFQKLDYVSPDGTQGCTKDFKVIRTLKQK